MKVYVLVYFDEDDDEVVGVYSTYDLAFNYAKEHYPKYYYTIKSFIIDDIDTLNRD